MPYGVTSAFAWFSFSDFRVKYVGKVNHSSWSHRKTRGERNHVASWNSQVVSFLLTGNKLLSISTAIYLASFTATHCLLLQFLPHCYHFSLSIPTTDWRGWGMERGKGLNQRQRKSLSSVKSRSLLISHDGNTENTTNLQPNLFL